MLRQRSPMKPIRRKAAAKSERSALGQIARRPNGVTHGERLRQEIADLILDGTLPPGTALDEKSLAERHGVSRTPVREALRELAAAGLVEHRPHRGAVVAAITQRQLEEMFEVMADLEALCAGYAAATITPPERVQLLDLQQAAEGLVRAGDLNSYTEANDRFHDFIYATSHNGFLSETVKNVRLRLSPFRRAQFRTLGRLAVSHEEHDRVVQAILRGDKDAAAREMRTHIGSVHHSFTVFSERRD
ncbi:MAG: GntR family transcriptional regulator [Ancalomicrobiaceae bacterium]|nr:GntR family transcriptional regulator [Ancalomicrobiaceae bacterium]